MKEIDFEMIRNEFGTPFVVQFNRGHTGDGTLIIKDENQIIELKEKFPERDVKISKYIDTDLLYNLNVCIYRGKSFIAGINYQITGVEGLTNKERATVGNDFSSFKGISEKVIINLREEIYKITKIMSEEGYRGLYGVDFVIKDEEVYIIEVNARQTQSIPFLTKLQLMNDEIPLSLLHLAEFMDIEVVLDNEEYNINNMKPINAAQIFLRSKQEEFLVKGELEAGIYRLQSDNTARREEKSGNRHIIYIDEDKDMPLIFQTKGYSIDDIINNPGILILAKTKGMKVKQGDEIARIQILDAALDSEFGIKQWIIESMLSIEKYLK